MYTNNTIWLLFKRNHDDSSVEHVNDVFILRLQCFRSKDSSYTILRTVASPPCAIFKCQLWYIDEYIKYFSYDKFYFCSNIFEFFRASLKYAWVSQRCDDMQKNIEDKHLCLRHRIYKCGCGFLTVAIHKVKMKI